MRVVIVDTDVVSYLFKEHTRGDLYKPHLVDAVASISFMAKAELEQWAIVGNWGMRKHGELLQFISDNFIVIESTAPLCRHWAQVKSAGQRSGQNIDTADAWMAATALLYGAPLITHNAADFAHVAGLQVITES